MKWRFLKLDWKYAIGELLIVTVGVLVALGVDQWRQEEADSALELEYASRLKADLREDIIRFKNFEEIELFKKRLVLETFARFDNVSRSLDDSVFNTQNLTYSTYVALPEIQSATFKEMESSGKLRLIQNPTILVAIDDYYNHYQLLSEILKEPIGEYRKILAETIPGIAFLNSLINQTDLPSTELQMGLLKLTSHLDFNAAVNSELHYTASMIYWLKSIRKRCEELLSIMEEAYADSL